MLPRFRSGDHIAIFSGKNAAAPNDQSQQIRSSGKVDEGGDRMKSWFPFAEYEFYAYLSAGMLLIAAIDYSFGGSVLINRQSWTVAAVVFWIVIAYLIGHLAAGWSASFLDQFVGRRLFISSSDMLLGLKASRTRERLLAALSGATEYRPMSPSLSSSILTKVATRVGSNANSSIDGDAAFEAAFPLARP